MEGYPTKQDQYKSYMELYKHYSHLMFRARISIFTLVFISIGFIVKIIPLIGESGEPMPLPFIDVKIEQGSMVSYITAYLISILFLLEIAYYRRFLQIIKCLGRLEKESKLLVVEENESSFFKEYDRRNHYEYSFFYLASCTLLTGYFILTNIGAGGSYVFFLGAIPVFLLVFIYFFVFLKMFRRFKKSMESVVKS